MTPDDRDVRRLYLEALRLDGDGRQKLLDGACRDDPRLREEVESLLEQRAPEAGPLRRAWTDGGTGFESPALGLRHPEHIGPFKVLELLGEGAMGSVYLAEQTSPLHRRVAIKVIKWGLDTAHFVDRFQAERQVLALMSHPNIAQVYDAGSTERGRPYLVMEYVRGEPITSYCDQRCLSIPDRLELFIQVCQGIHHAHRKGIVHRDIKPSNVLVAYEDVPPIPKIIDFGVAKATGDLHSATLATGIGGGVIGTLGYMSPEQAARSVRRIDARTDLYSLGVLLYELLTGTLPFGEELYQMDFEDALKQIREVVPPRPSKRLASPGQDLDEIARYRGTTAIDLLQQVRGDLDSIVMRSLQKSREDRYSSTLDLGQDVRRRLLRSPVSARRGSLRRRVRKIVKHPILSAGIATLALGLSVAAVWVGTTHLGHPLTRRMWSFQDMDKSPEGLERSGLVILNYRPDTWRPGESGHGLRLSTERGDLWRKARDPSLPPANLVARPLTGRAYQVATAISDFVPQSSAQQAGIVVLESDELGASVRLTYGYAVGCKEPHVGIQVVSHAARLDILRSPPIVCLPKVPKWIELKVERQDDRFFFRYRLDYPWAVWQGIAGVEPEVLDIGQAYVGIAAFQGVSSEDHQPRDQAPQEATFEYLRLGPASGTVP